MFSFNKILRIIGLQKSPQIASIDSLEVFIEENAAFVSQVTLYTYVKARAGTSFVKMFENEAFLASLAISRWHIYAASVVDLTLFAAAQFHASGHASQADCAAIAKHLGGRILARVEQQDVDDKVFRTADKRLKARARVAKFDDFATGDGFFAASSDAFMIWAPVIDEFKALDEEIMRNSMHLRWIGIRRELRERLAHNEAYADWQGR